MKPKQLFYVFTPSGEPCLSFPGKTKQEAISRYAKSRYRDWSELQGRGYTVAKCEVREVKR